MKKNIIFAVILAFTVLSFSACSDTNENSVVSENPTVQSSSETSSDKDNSETSSAESDIENSTENNESSTEEVSTAPSTVASPLTLNTWGTASKYCTKEQSYIDVPVRITSVTKGENAEKIVKRFMDDSSSYNYTEPDQNAEWVIAEYEISLDGFPTDEGGVDGSITSFITGTDGDYIDYGDKKWSTTTINITDGKYYYEDIVKGQIAYQMIIGRTDYIITIGEYNETQSFFSESIASSENP